MSRAMKKKIVFLPYDFDTVIGIINPFRNDHTLAFIDPAMGDNGKLYPAFNEHYAKKNADLCAVADIADPNITEAAFLTGLPYRETYEEEYVRELLPNSRCRKNTKIIRLKTPEVTRE